MVDVPTDQSVENDNLSWAQLGFLLDGLGVEILSDDERQITLTEDDLPEAPVDLGMNLERDEWDESLDNL